MTSARSISVVVPTRDRPRQLAACLDALCRQHHAATEIIVVDDCSSDAQQVESVVARVTRARLVLGAGRGPAAARNRGVQSAHGDVICLTDDDCRPTEQWTARLAAQIDGGADVVAGATQPSPPDAVATVASQIITNELLAASLDDGGTTVRFAPTCNLAMTPSIAERFPFDESFPLAAGEDREWCDRVIAAGHTISYDGAATVAHRPELTVRTFWRQQVRYGRGAAHWRRRHTGDSDWQPVRFYLDLVRAGFTAGMRPGVLVVGAQVATGYGLLAESIASAARN
ncbi:MAG: glycosyltransferase [Actinomycetota bacterium]